MLRKNLLEVQRLAETVDEPRSFLRQLMSMPSSNELTTPLREIRRRVKIAQLAIIDGEYEQADAELMAVDAYAMTISKALDRLATDVANPLRSRVLSVAEGDLADTLKRQLIDNAGLRIDEVAKMSRDIASLGDPEQSPDLWNEEFRDVRDRSELVLREYVDFLAGLALRDVGFDHDLCRIADDFFRKQGKFGDFTWGSVTLPARDGACSATIARFIRLGFPEWTIWALPLAAHEFGHLVIGTAGEIEDFMARPGNPDELAVRRLCVADAFATYFMGPAYAWAAILMRFDPFVACQPGGGRVVVKRVETVLRMLARDTDTGVYAELSARLRAEWDIAVEGVLASAAAAMKQAAGAEVVVESDGVEVVALEQPVLLDGDLAEIDAIVDLIVGSFPGRNLASRDWARVDEWADWLWKASGRAEAPNDAALKPGIQDDIRHLLNAAWSCRVRLYGLDPHQEGSGNHQTADPLARMDRLAGAAAELWAHIEMERAAAAAVDVGGQPHYGAAPVTASKAGGTHIKEEKAV